MGNTHDDPPDSVNGVESKMLLSASVTTLAWAGGAILVLAGVILRLWLDSYQTDLSAIRTAISAEAAARIQLEIRVDALERYQIEVRENNKRRDELIRENKWRIEEYHNGRTGTGYTGKKRRNDE